MSTNETKRIPLWAVPILVLVGCVVAVIAGRVLFDLYASMVGEFSAVMFSAMTVLGAAGSAAYAWMLRSCE
jgi:TRAP-type C4-dicarboxylate transport system permease small subunit